MELGPAALGGFGVKSVPTSSLKHLEETVRQTDEVATPCSRHPLTSFLSPGTGFFLGLLSSSVPSCPFLSPAETRPEEAPGLGLLGPQTLTGTTCWKHFVPSASRTLPGPHLLLSSRLATLLDHLLLWEPCCLFSSTSLGPVLPSCPQCTQPAPLDTRQLHPSPDRTLPRQRLGRGTEIPRCLIDCPQAAPPGVRVPWSSGRPGGVCRGGCLAPGPTSREGTPEPLTPGEGARQCSSFPDRVPAPSPPTPDHLAGVACGGHSVPRVEPLVTCGQEPPQKSTRTKTELS